MAENVVDSLAGGSGGTDGGGGSRPLIGGGAATTTDTVTLERKDSRRRSNSGWGSDLPITTQRYGDEYLLNTKGSLWDRVGGEEVVNEVIRALHTKCEQDERMIPFFGALANHTMLMKRLEFATLLLNGPKRCGGRGINATHRPLLLRRGLDETHFDLFGLLLKEALVESRVNPYLVVEVLESFESWKDCVLSRGDWGD